MQTQSPDPSTRSQRPRQAGLLAAALALAGCASISKVVDNERAGEQAGAPAPYEVAITRERVLPGAPDAVFAFIAAEDVLPKILTGYGLLPAVVRTSAHTGPWDRAGSARTVHLADGSTVQEQVTHIAAPASFAYRVWDFGNPIIKRLADGARGHFSFEPAPGGTRVIWSYTFSASNGAAALPLSGIVGWLWRGYMDVCLDNAHRLLSAAPPVTAGVALLH